MTTMTETTTTPRTTTWTIDAGHSSVEFQVKHLGIATVKGFFSDFEGSLETDEERRQYLSESLFLNFVSYENERLGAYMKKLSDEKEAVE